MVQLAARAKRMQPSATLAVVGKAKSLKREGKPVISFGAGEPDFSSPPSAIAYAREAMERGETHYTQAVGLPELREEVCRYYKDRFSLSFDPGQVIVGAGAKPLIYETLGALVDPGDEVIVFSPAWVSYVEQIRLFEGRETVIDTTGTKCIPNLASVEKTITARTRGILINTPNNPTGAVYDAETLEGLARMAIDHDLWIIYDEIYERLVYGSAKHHNILSLVPEATDRVIIVNGVSKAFAMTGWRIGYAIVPEWLKGPVSSFQGHLTSNPCSIAQWASLGALREAENDVERMRLAFSERRDLIVEMVRAMPHVTFPEPDGAFYVFLDIGKTLGKKFRGEEITGDVDFCRFLLEAYYVAAVPGTGFLAPGFVRLGYANATEEIREGMEKLSRFLEELKD